MGRGEAGQGGADPAREQELAAGFLVGISGAGDLGGEDGLSDVAGSGAEQHGAAVVAGLRVTGVRPVGQLAGDVVHEPQVGSQPRGRLEFLQQAGCAAGQRPEPGVAGTAECGVQASPAYVRGSGPGTPQFRSTDEELKDCE